MMTEWKWNIVKIIIWRRVLAFSVFVFVFVSNVENFDVYWLLEGWKKKLYKLKKKKEIYTS